MRKTILVFVMMITVLLLVACSENEVVEDEVDYFAVLDEVHEVDNEEYSILLEEVEKSWMKNATSLNDESGFTRYTLEDCRSIQPLSCSEYVEDSDFDLDFGYELLDYYIELREERTIKESNEELFQAVERSLGDELEIEMYEDFVKHIKLESGAYNLIED